MPKMTPMQAIAAGCRYPDTFAGHSPNEEAYWWEPGLVLLPNCPQLEYTADGRVLYKYTEVEHNRMAPRFRRGTRVGLERVLNAAAIRPGAVYLFQNMDEEDRADGFMAYDLGRLVGHTPDFALFEYDNGGKLHTRPLLWHEDFFRLYRVSHYISVPAIAATALAPISAPMPLAKIGKGTIRG